MSSITLVGDISGSAIIQAPSVAGTPTLTLPTTSGTFLTSANTFANSGGPAFSAYLSGQQSISSATWTKLTAGLEEFDTANCYDNSTNYRFTPNVAGYYQVNGAITLSASSGTKTDATIAIYKNGSVSKRGSYVIANTTSDVEMIVSAIIYLNGSTDYVELYGYLGGATSPKFGNANAEATYFQAAMIRGA